MVPYRCKGRFCTTCSCGKTEEWSRLLMMTCCKSTIDVHAPKQRGHVRQ
ncbi:hypothetical protein [Cohnella hongkongensis]|uniref:Uncharacterized protein n=1 Tax=Cohnella hongkongensis TaxID=178337 RepID=A0ABV9FCG4_9BACL